MPGWTSAQMPSQDGRRVVVTGANSGIGFHTALELARRGASVVMAVRDPDGRGRAAADRVLAAVPGAALEVRRCDLASLASVRAFAEEWGDEPLDLLVNNAGVMALPRQETADGFEMQLGTNHLGHFALTGRLLRALARAPAPRVVTVSSTAHHIGRIRWDDLHGERRYHRWTAYGQSKLANLLFAFELQRRADAARVALTSVAAHPGYAATNLQFQANNLTGTPVDKVIHKVLNTVVAQSEQAGAWPTLYAATEDVVGGAFIGPDGPGEMRGHPRLASPTRRATDPDAAARLWEVSEQLTGVRFEWAAAAAPA